MGQFEFRQSTSAVKLCSCAAYSHVILRERRVEVREKSFKISGTHTSRVRMKFPLRDFVAMNLAIFVAAR